MAYIIVRAGFGYLSAIEFRGSKHNGCEVNPRFLPSIYNSVRFDKKREAKIICKKINKSQTVYTNKKKPVECVVMKVREFDEYCWIENYDKRRST